MSEGIPPSRSSLSKDLFSHVTFSPAAAGTAANAGADADVHAGVAKGVVHTAGIHTDYLSGSRAAAYFPDSPPGSPPYSNSTLSATAPVLVPGAATQTGRGSPVTAIRRGVGRACSLADTRWNTHASA